MPLTSSVLLDLRAELGQATQTGVDDDDTLEVIYEDTNTGNGNVLLTAWYVWKRRLGDLQTRSFDTTTGGGLMNRSQRIRFILGRIAEIEFALGNNLARSRARMDDVKTLYQVESTTTEFS